MEYQQNPQLHVYFMWEQSQSYVLHPPETFILTLLRWNGSRLVPRQFDGHENLSPVGFLEIGSKFAISSLLGEVPKLNRPTTHNFWCKYRNDKSSDFKQQILS